MFSQQPIGKQGIFSLGFHPLFLRQFFGYGVGIQPLLVWQRFNGQPA
jgi:hypothetical protein